MQKRKGETALKPNFLIFVTDQHRADWLSCMGNDILQTPHIDKIAHRGVLFENTYCNTPLCLSLINI